jgi:hypothetical protein
MNPLFSERQRRRMNPVFGVAPENEERSTALNAGLAQTWPVRAVEGVVNPVLGMIEHTGEVLAGRADAGDVTKPWDFVSAMADVAPATAARNAAGIFGGKLSATADYDKLAKAMIMSDDKAGLDDVWEATGWFKDQDKKWRYEIPDDKAALKERAMDDLDAGFHKPLGDILEHPELFKAYPHLKDIKVHNRPTEGAHGTFFGDNIGLRMDRTGKDVLSTLLHEVQHGVQQKEGFARGGSPSTFAMSPEAKAAAKAEVDELRAARSLAHEVEAAGVSLEEAVKAHRDLGLTVPDNAVMAARMNPLSVLEKALTPRQEALKRAEDPHGSYMKLLGEIEARDVQSRQRMTPEERMMAGPWWGRNDWKNAILMDQSGRLMDSRRGGLGGLGGR